MTDDRDVEPVEPVKDLEGEYPVAVPWRPVFVEVVRSFVRGDFSVSESVHGVLPIEADTAEWIRDSVAGYGNVSLIDLPEDTWSSSIAAWQGDRWEVLVDLWTAEEGRSDLVLHAFVREASPAAYEYEVYGVYVP